MLKFEEEDLILKVGDLLEVRSLYNYTCFLVIFFVVFYSQF